MAAGNARRWTWLVATGASAALAGSNWSLALALVGLGVALLTAGGESRASVVGSNSRASVLGTLAGGCAVVVLVADVEIGPHGLPTLLTAAALVPILASAFGQSRRRVRRRVRQFGVVGATLGGVILVLYGVAVASARVSVERGISQIDNALVAARAGKATKSALLFDSAASSFDAAHDTFDLWWVELAQGLPVVGHNARVLETITGRAATLSAIASRSAVEADVDAIRMRDGKLDLKAVRTMAKPLRDAQAALRVTLSSLNEANSPWLVPPLRSRVQGLRTMVRLGHNEARLAADAVDVLPAILGGDGPRRYFVAIGTPVEARGRTGFLGNFAELTAVDGDIEMPRFGRNADLRDGGLPLDQRTITGPADYLARYGRFQPQKTWQNVNLSPDMPTVARVIGQLYPQSGGTNIDGVLSVNTAALAALMRFTGPVSIEGVAQPITSANAADFLLRGQYVELQDSVKRIDALEALSREVFGRLVSGTLPGPRQLAKVLGPLVRAGHLQFASLREGDQAFLERIGIDGSLPPVDGDFVSVVNSNASGSKIELFLDRSTAYDVSYNRSTGTVDATLKVTLRNRAPSSGLPPYLIGNAVGDTALDGRNLPSGTNRLYLSVYTPWDLVEGSVSGVKRDFEHQRELRRSVVSSFIEIPPGETRVVELRLRGEIDPGEGYRLTVVPQPLVKPERFVLSVTAKGKTTRQTWVMDRTRKVDLR